MTKDLTKENDFRTKETILRLKTLTKETFIMTKAKYTYTLSVFNGYQSHLYNQDFVQMQDDRHFQAHEATNVEVCYVECQDGVLRILPRLFLIVCYLQVPFIILLSRFPISFFCFFSFVNRPL